MTDSQTTMESIAEVTRKAFTDKGHWAEYYVPGVKFIGITIRKPYTRSVFFKCDCGESVVDKMVSSLFSPSPLFTVLLKNTVEK